MKRIILCAMFTCWLLAGCDSGSESGTTVQPPEIVGPTTTRDVPATHTTIQAAVDASGSGDFIRVAAGVYTEDVVVGSKSISLRGAGVGQTILQGSLSISNSSETSLEGFTIRGGSIHAINSMVRISDNEITASPGAGLWLEQCFGVVISDNTIHFNNREGILADDSDGMIGVNRVMSNGTDGIVVNNASPTLQANTVASNSRDGISIRGFQTYAAAPLLLANTVQQNGSVSNYDIICFGSDTNPTGGANVFDSCLNCAECGSFSKPLFE